jgi:hypothetical protein
MVHNKVAIFINFHHIRGAPNSAAAMAQGAGTLTVGPTAASRFATSENHGKNPWMKRWLMLAGWYPSFHIFSHF